jgi:DNA-directed RNA polymerase specialized sigma24 family protein
MLPNGTDLEPPAVRALDDLYRTHRAEAVRLAWLLTHDAAIAEDVAHDAFVALFRSLDHVDNPRAYLRRSVVNGVYERTRKRARELRRNGLVVAGQALVADGPTGGVLDAVSHLPRDQRTAIVLRYWGGLRDHEIAAAMGIRPGTARSHLSRATARLRRELL